MRDEGDLLRESLDVLGLLREVAHRDEEREVRVLMARRLDHVVERALHQLPDAIAVRPDHHAPAHRGVIGELRLHDDIAVPLAEVLRAWGDSLRFSVLSLCHQSKYPLRSLSNGTFASVPAFKSRTTARPACRSSGPMITARGAPRDAASSSCLRTPVCRSPYSTAMPRSRIAWASLRTQGISSPPTAIKPAPSSIDASAATARSLTSSPSTSSPMPNPNSSRSSSPSSRPPPAIA